MNVTSLHIADGSGALECKLKLPAATRCTNPCQYLGVTPFVLSVLVDLGRVKLTRPVDGKPYYAVEDLDAFAATLAHPIDGFSS